MSSLATFRPLGTLAALEQVRTQHQRERGAPIPESDRDWLAILRVRIHAAETDDLVRPLALSLSPQELWGCLELLAKDKEAEIRQRCRSILLLRNRVDLVKPAWFLLVQHPGYEIEGFLRAAGEEHGWGAIDDSSYIKERLARWFSRPELTQGLLDDMSALRVSDPDEWLGIVGIPPKSALGVLAWGRLLGEASKELFSAISHANLVERARSMPTEVQAAFATNYLRKLATREFWQDVSLRFVRDKFGTPEPGEVQSPFWRPIPQPIRDEFRVWVQEQLLYEFFRKHDGTSERFSFWKRYSKHWKGVFQALDGRAMAMDFGHAGVIEFAEVGNAAYVYEGKDFRRIVGGRANAPADYKDQRIALHRVLHFEGWQFKAQYDMDRIILQSPRS